MVKMMKRFLMMISTNSFDCSQNNGKQTKQNNKPLLSKRKKENKEKEREKKRFLLTRKIKKDQIKE